MQLKIKRLILGIVFGMIAGGICVIGHSQRLPAGGVLPSTGIYLLDAWYNRVLMGLMIGFAGEFILVKKSPITNAIVRGALIGLIVSVSHGLLQQFVEPAFFVAGIFFGIFIDFFTTKFSLPK